MRVSASHIKNIVTANAAQVLPLAGHGARPAAIVLNAATPSTGKLVSGFGGVMMRAQKPAPKANKPQRFLF